MLGSNNYLGLTRHPRVMAAAREAVDKYGTSMTGSRLMNGTTTIHLELEEKLAHFLGKEGALVFSTGYQANLGAISALVNRRATAVIDKGDHASIYDGTRLSDGDTVRFRHNEPNHLEQVLASVTEKKAALVVIDGVYSMGGDIAELPSIVDVCRRYQARLMVDDAHAIGVIGEGGRGTGSHFGLEDEVDLTMGTFSKSLASIGGFLAGPEDVLDWIRHFARPMVFSASMAPPSVAAASTALDVLMDEPELVDRVQANGKLFREGLRNAGFDIGPTQTPIVPIIIGDEVTMVGIWRALLDRGVYTNAAIWPAVGKGEAMLRTSCMATHSEQQIKTALEIICELGRDAGLIS
jgi:8-amino-7-oxononanoate synthase